MMPINASTNHYNRYAIPAMFNSELRNTDCRVKLNGIIIKIERIFLVFV